MSGPGNFTLKRFPSRLAVLDTHCTEQMTALDSSHILSASRADKICDPSLLYMYCLVKVISSYNTPPLMLNLSVGKTEIFLHMTLAVVLLYMFRILPNNFVLDQLILRNLFQPKIELLLDQVWCSQNNSLCPECGLL